MVAHKTRRHPGRALVVMGDPERGRQVERWVAELTGADVTRVRDLRTGWSLCGSSRWSVVVVAAGLHDGPGLALLSRVRTDLPGTPTVLFTEDAGHLDDTEVGAFVSLILPLGAERETVLASLGTLGLRMRALEGRPMASGYEALGAGQGRGFDRPRYSDNTTLNGAVAG
jgi:hypothetical protein